MPRFKPVKISQLGEREVWQVEDTRHKDFNMPIYSSTVNFTNIIQAMECANAQNESWEIFLARPY